MNTLIPRTYRRVTLISEAREISGGGGTDQGRSTFNMSGIRPDSTQYTNMSQSGTAAVTDLASLQALFRYYRIVKIRVFFRLTNTEFTDAVQFPVLYTRYCYDPNTPVPTTPQYFNELTNVNRHSFTNDSPEFVTTIYPKIMTPKYALTGLTSDGFAYSPASPGWIDFAGGPAGSQVEGADCQHFGLDWFITNVPTGQSLTVDVEFTVDYKTQV